MGCVKRDIERKVENPNIRLKSLLEISERILTQSKNSKIKSTVFILRKWNVFLKVNLIRDMSLVVK
ncbi:hypothetical protein LEP1GSC170_1534 [Leptospira interrogans serovar Bataviae str. HAI135]|nr:hypothetical protein LEP1GSC170_1534 [Leptospira interrogans serovar Bataviae str. HAI135]